MGFKNILFQLQPFLARREVNPCLQLNTQCWSIHNEQMFTKLLSGVSIGVLAPLGVFLLCCYRCSWTPILSASQGFCLFLSHHWQGCGASNLSPSFSIFFALSPSFPPSLFLFCLPFPPPLPAPVCFTLSFTVYSRRPQTHFVAPLPSNLYWSSGLKRVSLYQRRKCFVFQLLFCFTQALLR